MTENEAWKKFGDEIRQEFAVEIQDTIAFLVNISDDKYVSVHDVKDLVSEAFVQGVICKVMHLGRTPSGNN